MGEIELPRGEGTGEPTEVEKPLTAEQFADLQSPETQEAYRRAFLEELRRRSCPGCADEGPLPF